MLAIQRAPVSADDDAPLEMQHGKWSFFLKGGIENDHKSIFRDYLFYEHEVQ